MPFIIYFFLVFIFIHPACADVKFLTITDIHYGPHNPPGNGHDTGKKLLGSALNKFSQLANEVDFIITLGDFPTHSFSSSNQKQQNITLIFQNLYQSNTTKKPMFYVTGNNDSLLGDYMPFSNNTKSLLSLAKDWDGSCIHCDGLMVDKTHMDEHGYYSTYVIPGNKDILLIALNSTQFAKTPFYIRQYPDQMHDAMIQLQWLAHQLKTQHAKQLLIAMHIPPGINYQGKKLWKDAYLEKFIELLKTYHHRYGQVTLLAAHEHMDNIRKIRLDKNMSIYSFSTPGISRLHLNNPGMKIFKLNSKFKLINFTTYYTTTDDHWREEQYQAVSNKNSLFPQCSKKSNLSDCLDSLSDELVCKVFQDGMFYGVKSPDVDNSVCQLTYPVNHIQ